MKLRLRSWSLLTSLSTIGLVVASLSVLLLWQFDQSTERIRYLSAGSLETQLVDQLRDYGTQMGSNLATEVAAPLTALDMQALRDLLRTAAQQPNVKSIEVFDQAGALVADGSMTVPRFGRILRDVDTAATSIGYRQDSDELQVDVPVEQFGVRIGGVRVSFSLTSILGKTRKLDGELDAIIDQGKRFSLMHVAVTCGIFLLLAYWFAVLVGRNLVTPIRRLAAYASAVGLGQYDMPLPTTRTDELGDLARSLREMSENLQITTGEVNYLAYHDSLTRLPNRAQLKQSLRQSIARGERGGHSVALLFIDLDDFKRVNDTLGHEAGDTLLKEFALRLRHCLRSGDEFDPQVDGQPRETIARLGGDEFTVVLNNVRESSDAGMVAKRILAVLRDPFVLSGQEVVIGASIGVTTFPEDGHDVDTLLRNADVAMYQAKERGKNHFEFYNDSMHRMATERLSLETDLRHAIEYEQMRILYQPVLDTKTRALVGVDAHLRWIHPALGNILPTVFGPLAEQTGFIVRLDEWVLDRACADIAELSALGYDDFAVGVGVSSLHFRDQSIAPSLIEALNRHRVDAGRVALSVSEKTMMRNFERSSELLSGLRERGVRSWVSEFGSGHSPLRFLSRMPVTGVRIDSEYISALARGDDERALVSSVIAMAQSLNLRVTATGVENTEQMAVLTEVGCDNVQGSLFARPMLLADLVTYLAQHSRVADATEQTGTFGPLPFSKPKRAR
ncbi:MAG: putative bifunctional diguanylate cyclase/phosphodiesterase [Gammaproteobacteria bacterium]